MQKNARPKKPAAPGRTGRGRGGGVNSKHQLMLINLSTFTKYKKKLNKYLKLTVLLKIFIYITKKGIKCKFAIFLI